MRTNYFEWGLPNPPEVDGLDAFEDNIKYVEKLGVYRRVWHDVLPCQIPRNTYSTILASEVLEHLPIETVAKVLDEFEASASERIVITTPNWECLRGGVETFLGMNQFDAHLSFVNPSFLKDRGYKVLGAGIGNPRTIQARVLGRCLKLLRIKDTTTLYSASKYLPSIAHTIVAYKDLSPVGR